MGLFGKRAPKEKPRRLFFATDLHGSSVAWRKMLNSVDAYKAEALICGGDLAGKRLYPIIDRGAGRYLAHVHGRDVEVEGDAALADAKAKLAEAGGYYRVMDQETADALAADPARMEVEFVACVRERLAEWIALAEDRLARTGTRCYVTGGNDDEEEMLEPLFEEQLEHVVPSENRVVDVLGHPMVSLGWSNETPWKTPRETTEEHLAELVEEAIAPLESAENAIFNFHVPPKDSTLDTCPKLDTSQWPPVPVMVGGQIVTFGAGSTAIRDAIASRQPLLSLHGHIHESAAATSIGRTVCINPGSDYQDGALLGTLVLLRPDKVVDFQLTRG
jgi:Icc-related predicted phosphoesterase